jgi:two-component system sensor histidine kinase UhpB
MTAKRIFLVTLFTLHFSLFTNLSFAQRAKDIEKFQEELSKYEADKKELGSKFNRMMDTTKANIYSRLAWGYYLDNTDSALYYSELLKELSERIGYKKGLAKYYNGLGLTYMNKHLNIPLALEDYNKAVKIYSEIGDKDGLGWTYNNMGLLYLSVDNYAEAIKAHTNALKVREEIGDKANMSESYRKRARNYETAGNYPEALKDILSSLKVAEEAGFKEGIETSYKRIGEIYEKEGNYPEALKNFIASSKVRGKTGSKFSIATSYENLGRVYLHQGQYEEAEKNFRDGLTIFEEINNPAGIQECNADIGTIYFDKGNYDDALKYYLIALKIAEEMRNNSHIADLLNKITLLYKTQKKYQDALRYATRSLSVGLDSKYMDGLKEAYGNLAEIYGKLNDYASAYKYQVLFQHLKDSLVNNENTNKMKQLEMQYKFDKDLAAQKAEQDKKDAQTQLEIQKQKNIQFRMLGGAVVLIAFVIGLIFRNRNKQRIKVLEIRQGISRDLHDEIGASLSSVQLMSSFAAESLNGSSSDAKQWMNRIGENTTESMEKIRDIVWTLNSSKDISANIITRMNQFISHSLEPKDIACNFISDEEVNDVLSDFIRKRNVYLIFKEAVNNAAKYSEATEVNIKFKIENKKLLLTISDNGKGFDAAIITRGNGLNNMLYRAKQINAILEIKSSKGEGTFISLKMPVTPLRYKWFKKAV